MFASRSPPPPGGAGSRQPTTGGGACQEAFAVVEQINDVRPVALVRAFEDVVGLPRRDADELEILAEHPSEADQRAGRVSHGELSSQHRPHGFPVDLRRPVVVPGRVRHEVVAGPRDRTERNGSTTVSSSVGSAVSPAAMKHAGSCMWQSPRVCPSSWAARNRSPPDVASETGATQVFHPPQARKKRVVRPTQRSCVSGSVPPAERRASAAERRFPMSATSAAAFGVHGEIAARRQVGKWATATSTGNGSMSIARSDVARQASSVGASMTLAGSLSSRILTYRTLIAGRRPMSSS